MTLMSKATTTVVNESCSLRVSQFAFLYKQGSEWTMRISVGLLRNVKADGTAPPLLLSAESPGKFF